MSISKRLFAAAAAAILGLTACSSEPDATTSPPNDTPVPDNESASGTPDEPSETEEPQYEDVDLMAPAGDPKTIAEGLDIPWSLVFVGDQPLFSQRDRATISTIVDGEVIEVARVSEAQPAGEGGLLGLEVEPEDPSTLYAYYTSDADNRVVSYPLTHEGDEISMGEETILVDGIPKERQHNGGRIKFGPDGKLYIATGDAGQRDASQDADSLGGKILRLNADGTIPDDNPSGTEVWTLGHRNVQGLAWDETDQMWATEFGQDTWDELNIIEPENNYGWPEVEGTGGEPDYTDPVITWKPAEASPSGLLHKDGNLYVASLRGERMWVMLASDPDGTAEHFLGDGPGRIRDIVAAPDDTLWVLTSNGGNDRILSYQLAPA